MVHYGTPYTYSRTKLTYPTESSHGTNSSYSLPSEQSLSEQPSDHSVSKTMCPIILISKQPSDPSFCAMAQALCLRNGPATLSSRAKGRRMAHPY